MKIKKKQKAKKHDDSKPQIDLIPYEAIEGCAKVFTWGLKKYGRINWQKGIEYSRLISATFRHLGKFNKGLDIDDESLLCHIDHCLANLSMLKWMIINKPEYDNRWSKKFLKGKK